MSLFIVVCSFFQEENKEPNNDNIIITMKNKKKMMMSHHHWQWSNELWILAKISISSDIELIKKNYMTVLMFRNVYFQNP